MGKLETQKHNIDGLSNLKSNVLTVLSAISLTKGVFRKHLKSSDRRDKAMSSIRDKDRWGK